MTYSIVDWKLIGKRRGEHNQLGFASQIYMEGCLLSPTAPEDLWNLWMTWNRGLDGRLPVISEAVGVNYDRSQST